VAGTPKSELDWTLSVEVRDAANMLATASIVVTEVADGAKTRFVGGAEYETPEQFFVDQNYPNPFNPVSEVQYGLPEDAQVQLIVYNTLGQEVIRLIDGKQTARYKSATFHASGLPSGVYFYRMNATGIQTGMTYTKVMKMLLMK
jgi:hypothetical protein